MADKRILASILSNVISGAVGAGIVLGAQYFIAPPAEPTILGPDAAGPAAFGAKVKDYLMSDPTVIISALQKHQADEEKSQIEAAKQFIKGSAAAILNDPASPVVGNPKGDVTLVEFFDYNCHFCRGVQPFVADLIAQDPNLRVVHKQLPILGPTSLDAAKVALAAHMQNPAAYETISKAFMAHEGVLTDADIEKTARDAGVDWKKILVDKESDAVKNEIRSDYELAQKLGLSGTPGFVVGDQLFPGAKSEEDLKAAIAAARTTAKTETAPSAATATPPAAPAPQSNAAPDGAATSAAAAPAPDPTPQDAAKMAGPTVTTPVATAPGPTAPAAASGDTPPATAK